MALGKSRRSSYLILGGAILLFFLAGLLCTTWLFSPGQQPASLATPTLTFATVTPGGPPPGGVQPIATSAADSPPVPCGPLPAGWTAYTIRSGDTLSQLAEQARVSQAQILAVNCLDSPELLAGMTLYLPPLPTPTPCSIVPPSGWSLYTVQGGDTLSALAAARNISMEEVKRRNCLASADILEGQQFYLPLLPTPTPCVTAPPPNWGLYTVQSGDTLFSLALTHSVTADQVKQVNCLPGEAIQVGQQLYLPLLPTPTPIPLPPPTLPPAALSAITPPSAEVAVGGSPSQPGTGLSTTGQVPPAEAGSSTSEEQSQAGADTTPGGEQPLPPGIIGPPLLPELRFQPGQPYGGFEPCSDTASEPRLQILGENEVQLGERAYFFVCDFTDEPDSASITWPNGQIQPVELQETLPNPTLQKGNAQAIIDWPVLPFYPTDNYTLTVTGTLGTRKELPFTVVFPSMASIDEHILVIPSAGPLGTTFQVYYVGFTLNSTATLTIYGKSDSTFTLNGADPVLLRGVVEDPVYINQPFLDPPEKYIDKGWGLALLYLAKTEPPGLYFIQDDERKGENPANLLCLWKNSIHDCEAAIN